jgi:sugar lactone lactonase YvrE
VPDDPTPPRLLSSAVASRHDYQLTLLIDAHAAIGESPTWVAEQNALYWIDVKAPTLNRFELASARQKSWKLSSDAGAFALTRDGGAIVALRQGIHRLDLESGALELLEGPPFHPELFRFNEGICDAKGRFWIGVMFDPVEGDPAARPGSLHSWTKAGGLRQEPDAAELHNGMAWSADGRRLFISHSYHHEIHHFDFDPEAGTLSNRQLFASVAGEGVGIPDGAAIDVEGAYWCALHDGGRLRRFMPDGSVDRDIELPVSKPTMCVFGGPEMDTLYITSASDGLTPEQLQQEPHSGAVFTLKPGVQGISRPFLV